VSDGKGKDSIWQQWAGRWRHARRAQPVVYAGGCAAGFAFVSQLLGVAGWATLAACALVASAGALFAVANGHRREHAMVAAAIVLIVVGSAITVDQALRAKTADPAASIVLPATVASASPVAEQENPLGYSLEDDWEYLSDGSRVFADEVTLERRQGFPAGSTKVGAGKLKLTLHNSGSQPLTIVDVRAVEMTIAPPLAGTLAYSTAEGNANELMALDLNEKSPVLREISRSGHVGDPYFPYSHIDLDAGRRQVLELTIVPGPHLYAWKLAVDYQIGAAQKTLLISKPAGLLTISGYADSYRRVYQLKDGWERDNSATFCAHRCQNLGSHD
jgi:hypothetical protein